MSNFSIFLFLLGCCALVVILPALAIRLGKSVEKYAREANEMQNLGELPDKIDFFYSKSVISFQACMRACVSACLLSLFSLFIWEPTPKKAEEIAIGILFLPVAILCAVQAISYFQIWINIKIPAISISKLGFQCDSTFVPWDSVEEVEVAVAAARTAFFTIKYKSEPSKKSEKKIIDLSALTQGHLPDYVQKYMDTHAQTASSTQMGKES